MGNGKYKRENEELRAEGRQGAGGRGANRRGRQPAGRGRRRGPGPSWQEKRLRRGNEERRRSSARRRKKGEEDPGEEEGEDGALSPPSRPPLPSKHRDSVKIGEHHHDSLRSLSKLGAGVTESESCALSSFAAPSEFVPPNALQRHGRLGGVVRPRGARGLSALVDGVLAEGARLVDDEPLIDACRE